MEQRHPALLAVVHQQPGKRVAAVRQRGEQGRPWPARPPVDAARARVRRRRVGVREAVDSNSGVLEREAGSASNVDSLRGCGRPGAARWLVVS